MPHALRVGRCATLADGNESLLGVKLNEYCERFAVLLNVSSPPLRSPDVLSTRLTGASDSTAKPTLFAVSGDALAEGGGVEVFNAIESNKSNTYAANRGGASSARYTLLAPPVAHLLLLYLYFARYAHVCVARRMQLMLADAARKRKVSLMLKRCSNEEEKEVALAARCV